MSRPAAIGPAAAPAATGAGLITIISRVPYRPRVAALRAQVLLPLLVDYDAAPVDFYVAAPRFILSLPPVD